MGVNHLWSILEPVRRKEKLSVLSNKTLCVDLSGWICESQGAKSLQENVIKPHLRNLFFRVLHLMRLGVKLVFVMDGKPPELKWDTIMKRSPIKNKKSPSSQVDRSLFDVWVKECRNLLDLLGVPCIESAGEAEALCAWLEINKKVDGCITNDGDAFLYGARNVYKDLRISKKDASVECYKMDEIETELKLNRQNLVAFGILLGCDYHSKGVPGVGSKKAMKLLENVNQDNLIDRFHKWTEGTDPDEKISRVEKSIKSKALKDKKFPHPKVIEEYLNPKVVEEEVSFEFTHPDLQGLLEFCLTNLHWKEEYTRKQVLLLITFWQMTSLQQGGTKILVEPERIVKARIQQGIKCYEVQWQNVELGETCPSSFVTTETNEIFTKVYPERVKEFNDSEATKQSKKLKAKSKRKRKSQEEEQGGDSDSSDDGADGSAEAKKTKSKSRRELFKKSRKEEHEDVIEITDSDSLDAISDGNTQTKKTKKTKSKRKKSRTEEHREVIEVSDSDTDGNTDTKKTKSKTVEHGEEHIANGRCSRLRKKQEKKKTTQSIGSQRSIKGWMSRS